MVESTAVTHLWLVRHGAPEAEMRGRCYGALDIPLSQEGREQVLAAAQYLQSEPLCAIYTSPLARAADSAAIVANGRALPMTSLADLCELNFGDLEGMTFDRISAAYPDFFARWMRSPTEVEFPNGESLPKMRERVLRALERIRRECAGKTAAVVSHAGVNRLLLAWVLQVPDSHLFRIGQDYAAINLITFSGEHASVSLLNHTSRPSASKSSRG